MPWKKLRKIANAPDKGSVQEAITRGDELVLRLLISNPLRGKILKTLTYKSDNSGEVYQTPAKLWRIRLAVSRKKVSTNGEKPNDVPVLGWLQNTLTKYVREFRPTLAIAKSADLFLSRSGNRFNSLDRQVFKLTKALISGCVGISPHAFQHLVASGWLTKFPNDFLTVSKLLDDSIQVVMSNYAHLKKEVAFNRYDEYVQQHLLAPMR